MLLGLKTMCAIFLSLDVYTPVLGKSDQTTLTSGRDHLPCIVFCRDSLNWGGGEGRRKIKRPSANTQLVSTFR